MALQKVRFGMIGLTHRDMRLTDIIQQSHADYKTEAHPCTGSSATSDPAQPFHQNNDMIKSIP